MTSITQLDLPPEYRFDVAEAAKGLEELAQAEPDAVIVVTLAELGAGGLGAESDIRLTATSAAALLATVSEDQRLTAGNRDLVALRVTRPKESAPKRREDAWFNDQTPPDDRGTGISNQEP